MRKIIEERRFNNLEKDFYFQAQIKDKYLDIKVTTS